MSSWRDQILKEFTPKVARLTLVADPDGLLLEEGILEGVRERGFELIPFEDHIAFRYAYESKFRSRWDRGEHTDLVVVLRSQASDLSGLPYDLLQAGRRLSFNLGDIFPNLSYPVVTALDRGDLDALYEAQKRHAPGQLGDNATKEFVLRHVFEIAPELVKQPSDLLRVLLRRHYRGQRIPTDLDERFIQLLGHKTGGGVANEVGFVLGYSLVSGMTVPAERAKNAGQALMLYTSSKTYPTACDSKMARPVKAGTQFECVAYRQYFPPDPAQPGTCFTWHPEGDEIVACADFRQSVDHGTLSVPPAWAGKSLTVVEQTPSVTLHTTGTVPAGGLAISVADGYGYIVFRVK